MKNRPIKQRVLYTFPTNHETKKGTMFIDEVKYKEIVKDLDADTDHEIDPAFPYMYNVFQYTVFNNRMSEHNFSLNLN